MKSGAPLRILCGLLALLLAPFLLAASPVEENAEKTAVAARSLLEKMIADHPQDLSARIAYGNLLVEQNDYPAARAAWLDALKLAPESDSIAQALGESELSLGNVRAAFAAYTRAYQLAPQDALHHFSLANVLFVFRQQMPMGEPEAIRQALEHFSQAAQLDPFNQDYARAYAETFYAVPNADWKAARAAWAHLADIAPKKDFAWLNLARVCVRAGDPAAARGWLAKVIDPAMHAVKGEIERQAAALGDGPKR